MPKPQPPASPLKKEEPTHHSPKTPADKARCTVVLNATDYDAKILNLLSHTNTKAKLKRESHKKLRDRLQKLAKEQAIDQAQYYRLQPGEAIPSIYGLPEIHKQGTPASKQHQFCHMQQILGIHQ